VCDYHGCSPELIQGRHYSYRDVEVISPDGTSMPLSQALAEAGVKLCLACERPGWLSEEEELHRDCTLGAAGQDDNIPPGLTHWSHYLLPMWRFRRES
jgi:hypothetical protein